MNQEELYNEYVTLREDYQVVEKHVSKEEFPAGLYYRTQAFEDILGVEVEDRVTVP